MNGATRSIWIVSTAAVAALVGLLYVSIRSTSALASLREPSVSIVKRASPPRIPGSVALIRKVAAANTKAKFGDTYHEAPDPAEVIPGLTVTPADTLRRLELELERSGSSSENWIEDVDAALRSTVVEVNGAGIEVGARLAHVSCFFAGCIGKIEFPEASLSSQVRDAVQRSSAVDAWRRIVPPPVETGGGVVQALIVLRPEQAPADHEKGARR